AAHTHVLRAHAASNCCRLWFDLCSAALRTSTGFVGMARASKRTGKGSRTGGMASLPARPRSLLPQERPVLRLERLQRARPGPKPGGTVRMLARAGVATAFERDGRWDRGA